MKQEKFKVAGYPTEKALWKHLEPSFRLLNQGVLKPVAIAVCMGTVIQRN